MVTEPEVLPPEWHQMLTDAEQAVRAANDALVRADGARQFVQQQIVKRFMLGERDQIDIATGVITRVPQPEQANG